MAMARLALVFPPLFSALLLLSRPIRQCARLCPTQSLSQVISARPGRVRCSLAHVQRARSPHTHTRTHRIMLPPSPTEVPRASGPVTPSRSRTRRTTSNVQSSLAITSRRPAHRPRLSDQLSEASRSLPKRRLYWMPAISKTETKPPKPSCEKHPLAKAARFTLPSSTEPP